MIRRSVFSFILAALIVSPAMGQLVSTPRPVPHLPPVGGVVGAQPQPPTGDLTPTVPVFTTPAPVLQAPAPVAVAPAPVAAQPVYIPPPACAPADRGGCAEDAAQCLVEGWIEDQYEINWSAYGPYIRQVYAATDVDASTAGQCSAELTACLQPRC